MPAGRYDALVDAIRRDVIGAKGVTTREDRARVVGGEAPAEMQAFLTKVRDESFKVTDGDIAALRAAGHTEDEIYELTVAAAVGIAYARREAATRALRKSP
jgi:alkylhydroperoxidase family enzyme